MEGSIPAWMERLGIKHHATLSNGSVVAWTVWTGGAGVPVELSSSVTATCRVLDGDGRILHPPHEDEMADEGPKTVVVDLGTVGKDLAAGFACLHEGDGACIELPAASTVLPESLGGLVPAVQAAAGTGCWLMVQVANVKTGRDDTTWEERNAVKYRGASGARMAGNEALSEGKLEEAGEQYSNAAEALAHMFAPTDTQPRLKAAGEALAGTVLSNLALVRGRQGRHADVVVAATSALARVPHHTKALFRRSRAHLALNDVDAAMADAKALVAQQMAASEADDGSGAAAAKAPGGVTSSVAALVRDITAARAASTSVARDMAGKMFGGDGPTRRQGKTAGLGSLYEDLHDYGDKTNRGLKHPGVDRCRKRWKVEEDPRDPTVQCGRAGDGVRQLMGAPPANAHWCSCVVCARSCCAALTVDCMDCAVECSDDCGYQPCFMKCLRRADDAVQGWSEVVAPWIPQIMFGVDRVLCGVMALVWYWYIWGLDWVASYFTNPGLLEDLRRTAAEAEAEREEAAEGSPPAQHKVRKGVRDTTGTEAAPAEPAVVEADGSGTFDLD